VRIVVRSHRRRRDCADQGRQHQSAECFHHRPPRW
jgi:hypothetical protein